MASNYIVFFSLANTILILLLYHAGHPSFTATFEYSPPYAHAHLEAKLWILPQFMKISQLTVGKLSYCNKESLQSPL